MDASQIALYCEHYYTADDGAPAPGWWFRRPQPTFREPGVPPTPSPLTFAWDDSEENHMVMAFGWDVLDDEGLIDVDLERLPDVTTMTHLLEETALRAYLITWIRSYAHRHREWADRRGPGEQWLVVASVARKARSRAAEWEQIADRLQHVNDALDAGAAWQRVMDNDKHTQTTTDRKRVSSWY